MQWKQWCTDEQWCRPILLASEGSMRSLASFRPPRRGMGFSAAQTILDWINRFEVWCTPQPVGQYQDFDDEFRWLREVVHHQVLGGVLPRRHGERSAARHEVVAAGETPGAKSAWGPS